MKMKKILTILCLTLFLLSCNDEKKEFTGKIIAPKDGANVALNYAVSVRVETQDVKNSKTKISFYLDGLLYKEVETTSYQYDYEKIVTIFNILPDSLSHGNHTFKAVSENKEGKKLEHTISATGYVSTGGFPDSPSKVSFSNGKIPEQWKVYSWKIDKEVGYDDHYSLRSVGYPAYIYATKTFDSIGYVNYYTKGGEINLFIDGVKAQVTSTPDPDQNDWMNCKTDVEKGKHNFRWETNGLDIYLDAVRFQ